MTQPALSDEPTNGTEGTVVPAIADDGAAGQPKGDSLEQRIRSDPDFAFSQYKKVLGESTKLYQKNKGYEAITKIADQLGGPEVAAGLLTEYAAVAQNAEVARVREHFRSHGTLPTTGSARSDETPDDDVYKDPQTIQIEALQRELQDVRNSISLTKGAIGKQTVTAMLTQLKADFPDGFDEYVLPEMQSNFTEWERTPNGRELLSSINYAQLKTVASRAILDNLDAISEQRHARILEAKKRAATGAPAQIMSNGREPAANRGHKNATEALNEFMRMNGGKLS